MKVISENRKVRFDYFVVSEYDAGMVLLGSEVKSLRQGKVSMGDSYVMESGMELWVHNLHISEYNRSNKKNHPPLRVRKLLLKKREIYKIAGVMKNAGMTVVPRLMFFNENGIAKLRIAVVKGKKLYDKREAIKTREWNREKSRLLRDV